MTLQDIRSGDLPVFTRSTTTLRDQIGCDKRLIIKNMTAKWKEDKKWLIKMVLINDLRFYMNFCSKYRWYDSFFFIKLQHFPIHFCILEPKFCRTFGLVKFNFLPDQHRFCQSGPTLLQHLEKTVSCHTVHKFSDPYYWELDIHAYMLSIGVFRRALHI